MMNAKNIIAECKKVLGNAFGQTVGWILRYWDSHAEKQRELVQSNICIGWDADMKKRTGIDDYRSEASAGRAQSEKLQTDAHRLDAVSDLITSPQQAARLLDGGSYNGKVKCRYFTRVGHCRMVMCTCEGRAQKTRGYHVILRGNRNPSRAPLCDKCLGKISRDSDYHKSLLVKPRDRRRSNERPKRKEKPYDFWADTVVTLRGWCREAGLPVSGTKGEIVERLTTSGYRPGKKGE